MRAQGFDQRQADHGGGVVAGGDMKHLLMRERIKLRPMADHARQRLQQGRQFGVQLQTARGGHHATTALRRYQQGIIKAQPQARQLRRECGLAEVQTRGGTRDIAFFQQGIQRHQQV